MKTTTLSKYLYPPQWVVSSLSIYAYTAAAFFLPLFLSHPQLLVGSAVNMLLFLGALQHRTFLLPLVIAPSVGAVMHGMLFGPFTVYLLYFLPFIWLGNACIVYGYPFVRRYVGTLGSALIAISAKVLLLFLVAAVLVSFGIVPSVFLHVMGTIQLLTACVGGACAFSAFYAMRRVCGSGSL